MTSNVREQIAEIEDVREALRLLAGLSEVKTGTLRLASGSVKGSLSFERGYITSACVTSSGIKGTKALEEILALPDAVFEFSPNPASGETLQEICVRLEDLLAHDFSLVKVSTEPRSIPQTEGGDNNPHSTGVVPTIKHEETQGSITEAIEAFDSSETTAVPALDSEETTAVAALNLMDRGLDEKYDTGAIPAYLAEDKSITTHSTSDFPEAPASAKAELEDIHETTSIEAMEDVLKLNLLDRGDDENYDTGAIPAFLAEKKSELGFVDPLETTAVPAMGEDGKSVAQKPKAQKSAPTPEKPKKTEKPKAPEVDPTKLPAEILEKVQHDPAAFIKELSAHHDRVDFEKSEQILDEDEESLSDEQKMLLEIVTKLSDTEGFHEEENLLQSQEDSLLLSEQKLEILENIQVDTKDFEAIEVGEELQKERALTDEQKQLLDEMRKLADPHAFHDAEKAIQDEGDSFSEEERWMMWQNAQLQSPEAQKAEFAKTDEKLIAGETELKPFVEPAPLTPDEMYAELDDIPQPTVTDGDYKPLHDNAEPGHLAVKEGDKGLIDRPKPLWHRIVSFRPERPEHFPIEKIMGPLICTLLCVGLFFIPAYLRKIMGPSQNEELAAEQIRLMMSEDEQAEVPYAVEQKDPAHKAAGQGSSSGGSGGTGGGGGGGGGGSGNVSGLQSARELAAKGWPKRALKAYLEFIALNPNDIGARIELIKYLKLIKDYPNCRVVCLDALKQKITQEQREEIWSLLRGCL